MFFSKSEIEEMNAAGLGDVAVNFAQYLADVESAVSGLYYEDKGYDFKKAIPRLTTAGFEDVIVKCELTLKSITRAIGGGYLDGDDCSFMDKVRLSLAFNDEAIRQKLKQQDVVTLCDQYGASSESRKKFYSLYDIK